MRVLYLAFMTLVFSYPMQGLPPRHFSNINKVENYVGNSTINYSDVLSELHNEYIKTEYSGLMGYNWYRGIILADLDKDGVYELYLNASAGSGFIHHFIHGYNPIRKEYYIINERMGTNYIFFVYNGDLYVFAIDETFSNRIEIYKPLLKGSKLSLEDIENKLYNEIMGLNIIENIYNPFEGFLVKDNLLN